MKTFKEIDIKYYDNSGNVQVRCTVPVTQETLVHYELMQSHYCKLSFKLSRPTYFLLGDFIETPYGRFELIDLTKAKDNDTIGYSYEIQFDAYYRKLKNKILKYRPNTGSQEATFSLTSKISTHIEVIMKNLAYYAKLDKSYLYDPNFEGEGTDYTYVIDASVDANAARLITYSNSSILDAIANIAQTFGCEWWFEGNILHFGTCENTNAITDFRLNDNIVSMSSSQSQSTYANRVYAFGAARNLPSGYKNDADADITKDGVVEKRLMLPNSAECSDKNKQLLAENGFELKNGYIQVSGLREDQYVEGVTTNDDIYPRNLIKTSKVTSYEKDVEDESTPEEGDYIKRTFYRVNSLAIVNEDGEKTGDVAFRKAYIFSGKNLHIVFQSGSLNGMDFECEFNPDGVSEILKDDDGNPILKDGKEQINPKSQVFEIVANEDYGRFLPDITLHPKDGDTFVLYNWDSTKLGDTLVSSASNELLTDSIKDLKKSMIDPTTYTCTAEANYSYNQGRGNLHGVGDRVNLYNKGYGDSYRASRIIGYEFCLDIPYDGAKYYVGEKPSYSRLNAMESKIEELVYNGQSYLNGNGGSGRSIYIIKSYDSLTPTDYNVFSAKAVDEQRLNKTKDDTAKGTITWEKIQKLLSGLQSGEFESGLYGHGAQVDKRGDAEFNSIFAREFIRAPKFVFNEIEVTKAEHWNTNGYGTIKTVDTQKHIISLKLEENDYGSLMVGDICRGIYADLRDTYNSSQNNEGTLDENNFIVRKGFFTSYFYVKKVITAQKGEFIFEYGKKSDAYPDPCPFMDFAQYGNFNNTQRQSSMYFSSRGRSYIEVLEGVNSWEIQAEHRVCRYGDLTGLFIRKDDGTMTNLKGNGLFAQNHVYLGGAVITLSNISDLDDLVLKLSTYDVTLSAYSSVITVDDMGNVIDGLWTQDSEGGNKQYRISTAVFVTQAGKPLLLEDESSKYCTEGHYRVYATGDGCDVSVANGTVFVTGIDNIKDGVAGSGDDSNFDYNAMRKMTDCKVTIVVELEGKGTRTLDFPIRIHHDSLPFMVCDLTNEHAAVSWHTKHSHYASLPLQTEVNMMYKNTPYDISELSASLPSSVSKYLKATVTDKAKAKVVTIDKVSDFVSDVLPTSFDITITAVAIYAGARYEYTKVLTVSKTSDYVIYELVPSVNSVTVDSADRVSPDSVSCDVWATSSDDKRYKVTSLPSGFGLYYSKNENALSSISLGGSVSVSASDNKVSFVLKHTEGGVEYIDDKEDIPVVSDGKESAVVYSSDNIVSIPVDVNGKVLSALNASVSFRIFAGDKELTVNSVAISSLPSNRAVSASVSNNVLVLKCGAGTTFGKEEVSYTLSVQGANGNVTHTGYTTVKVLPNVMGKSVKDVNTYYALNDSATSKPADSSFTYDTISSAVISSNANKYLWSGDKITYDDNTSAITGIYMVGRCSELATVTEQYAKTTTNSAPSGGWSETYPSVGKGVYVWSRDKITWKNGSVTYSAAQLVAYIGNDGKDGEDSTVPGPKGDSITITSTSVTYQVHDSGTTPPTGTWSLSIPSVTDEKPYLWTKTYVLYSDGTSTTSFSVATKGKQGASVTGRTGSVVRSSVWKTGVAFYCGDTLVNGQYYVDMVYVADDTETDGWAKYQCIKNHTSSSSITTSNGTYWKRMSSASIYAPLIVAKNASIDFSQGQQFNLMEGNDVWGSFRYVNSGSSPALWLGNTNPQYAPFSVTRSGAAKIADADVTGKITATSGQIAGIKISGVGLTNEGFNNDAYIVLRNDNYNTFAGIGYSVTPSESGINAVARFTNGETKNGVGESNYAMVVGASGASTNVAIGISGGYIEGLRIKTGSLTAGGDKIGNQVVIQKGINSVVLLGAGYYQLPEMKKEDDGYVLFIKNGYNGSVNLLSGKGVQSDGLSRTTFILCNRSDIVTDLTIESRGDAMIFVYHRDMQDNNSHYGCWVQYKCPRDW